VSSGTARGEGIECENSTLSLLVALSGTDRPREAPGTVRNRFPDAFRWMRIWARIEGEEIKGRVLYRAPEEEP
jgi:hypothetical protein